MVLGQDAWVPRLRRSELVSDRHVSGCLPASILPYPCWSLFGLILSYKGQALSVTVEVQDSDSSRSLTPLARWAYPCQLQWEYSGKRPVLALPSSCPVVMAGPGMSWLQECMW